MSTISLNGRCKMLKLIVINFDLAILIAVMITLQFYRL